MKSSCKTDRIQWKLIGKEAEDVKEELIEYQIKKFGFTEEEAKSSADIWIKAVNETAEEFGEDLESEN